MCLKLLHLEIDVLRLTLMNPAFSAAILCVPISLNRAGLGGNIKKMTKTDENSQFNLASFIRTEPRKNVSSLFQTHCSLTIQRNTKPSPPV